MIGMVLMRKKATSLMISNHMAFNLNYCIMNIEFFSWNSKLVFSLPTLGQAKDEVDGWLEKGSLASGWPSSSVHPSVRRTNATVHTRHHMAVKVNNFSKNSNILYLDWWEVRGCSKCRLPAWWARPPILLLFLMSRSLHCAVICFFSDFLVVFYIWCLWFRFRNFCVNWELPK